METRQATRTGDHATRRVNGRLGLALPFLLLALAPLVALGCAQPSTPAAQHTQTPNLAYVIDGNFLTAKNSYDLRITLVALATTDGHVAWQSAVQTSGEGDAPGYTFPPVSQNGAVYLGYYYDHPVDTQNTVRHGVIEALDAATGTLRWRRELGTELNGAPVVDGATVYISASVLHTENQQAPTESGLLAALDTQTGAVRWQRALDAATGMAASAAGRVYLIMSEQFAAHALALNANDGSIAWDYTSDAPLTRGGDAENSASSAPCRSAVGFCGGDGARRRWVRAVEAGCATRITVMSPGSVRPRASRHIRHQPGRRHHLPQ